MNAFEAIIERHVGAFKNAITTDIRKMLMGGDTAAPKTPRASKKAAPAKKARKAPATARKVRTTLDNDTVDAAVWQVSQHKEGVATGPLAKEMGIDKITTAKALKAALKAGKLTKTGEKRSTLYFAGSGGANGASSTVHADA